MAAQNGRNMLVKIKNSEGEFVTLAGLRTKTFRLNARTVDITDSDSAMGWKELLPGAGVKSAEISGAGIFRDTASDALARTTFFEQSAQDYQFIIPDFGVIEGKFLLTTLSYSGTYQGEANYELTLMSAGAPSFSAA